MAEETRAMTNALDEILLEELETVLLNVAPREAAASESYVERPEEFVRSDSQEQPLSFPGGGLAELYGPILLQAIVTVCIALLKATEKAALEQAAKAIVESLAKRFKIRREAVGADKVNVEKVVAELLMARGWPDVKAREAAAAVWTAGVNYVQRVADLSGAKAPEQAG
jgi:hypothetical protein